MKHSLQLLFLLSLTSLVGCRVNRYYYVAEEPVQLYEFASFTGTPVLTANEGDTLSATGTKTIQLGDNVPVEYRGYRFYAPSARARFLRIDKVRSKRDAMLPGIVYRTRLEYAAKAKQSATSN